MNPQIERTPILVADDNSTDVFFLERRLHTVGILNPLRHFEDGAEAIRAFERYDTSTVDELLPWLLFLDLRMPRMDGFAVLEWLHERHWHERITIVVLTTSDEPADMRRVTQLGAHRYLIKYPQPARLAEIVDFAKARAIGQHSPSNAISSAKA
jgi:CheY-like chemotaxis protein